MNHSGPYRNPSWWTETHTSGWERTKEALRRDWEQTKADVTDGGRELNQDVGDTVKQAAGKQPIPPLNVPNTAESWDDMEPGLRYGYGARQYYNDDDDYDRVEARLREDWTSAGNEPSTWERIKGSVRRGWNSVKRAAA